jgi:O-methyltransferase involved in polyketide biosynthesis
MKLSRKVALHAALLGATALTLLVPAYAQQETDPTWYDPWAKPAVHATQADTAVSKKPHIVRSADAARPKVKKEVKAQAPRGTERAALIRK